MMENQSVKEGLGFARKARTLLEEGKMTAARTFNQEAIVHFTKAIKQEANDYRYYLIRGDCYVRIKDYERAIADADRALHLEPSEVRGYFTKGLALVGLKKFDDAEICFMRVLEEVPDNEEARRELQQITCHRLVDRGYSKEDCEVALLETSNIFEDAIEWLESNRPKTKHEPPADNPTPTFQLDTLSQPEQQPDYYEQQRELLKQLEALQISRPTPGVPATNFGLGDQFRPRFHIPFPRLGDMSAAQNFLQEMPAGSHARIHSFGIRDDINMPNSGIIDVRDLEDKLRRPFASIKNECSDVNLKLSESLTLVTTASRTTAALGSIPNVARIGGSPLFPRASMPNDTNNASDEEKIGKSEFFGGATKVEIEKSEKPAKVEDGIETGKSETMIAEEENIREMEKTTSVSNGTKAEIEKSETEIAKDGKETGERMPDTEKSTRKSTTSVSGMEKQGCSREYDENKGRNEDEWVVPVRKNSKKKDLEYLTDPRNPRKFTSIIVRNLDHLDRGDEPKLKKMFANCGAIKSVYIVPGGHYGFVNFVQPEGASTALQTMKGYKSPSGKLINLAYQDPDYDSGSNSGLSENAVGQRSRTGASDETNDDTRNASIWIGNLVLKDVDELVQMFKLFGPIVSETYNVEKGWGIIRYTDPLSATEAIIIMNGQYINGKRIKVVRSQPKDCTRWKKGTCKMGKNCVFKHDPSLRGVDASN